MNNQNQITNAKKLTSTTNTTNTTSKAVDSSASTASVTNTGNMSNNSSSFMQNNVTSNISSLLKTKNLFGAISLKSPLSLKKEESPIAVPNPIKIEVIT
jgi:hypothetical protein